MSTLGTLPLGLPIGILALALLIDYVFGEPPVKFHPTVWMGKFTAALEPKLGGRKPWVEKLGGVFLALSCTVLFAVPVLFALALVKHHLSLTVYTVLAAVFLKPTFAIKAMEQHAVPVAEALKRGNVEEARRLVSRIVGRETTGLSEEQVISAAVESVGESTVDGIIAPLFYFALLGVPAAVAYRVINTLDSMVGYRDYRYANLGFFPARLDALANWFPARLTGFLMVLAAGLLGKDGRKAFRILQRDKNRTPSINAGWSLSAMAGALGVQLEKSGFYTLGDRDRLLKPEHILHSLRIMKLTAYLFIGLVVIPIAGSIIMVTG